MLGRVNFVPELASQTLLGLGLAGAFRAARRASKTSALAALKKGRPVNRGGLFLSPGSASVLDCLGRSPPVHSPGTAHASEITPGVDPQCLPGPRIKVSPELESANAQGAAEPVRWARWVMRKCAPGRISAVDERASAAPVERPPRRLARPSFDQRATCRLCEARTCPAGGTSRLGTRPIGPSISGFRGGFCTREGSREGDF